MKKIKYFELVGSIDALAHFMNSYSDRGYMFCLHPLDNGDYRLTVSKKVLYIFWRLLKDGDIL